MRHLLDTTDLSLKEIDDMIELANDIIANKKKYAHICDGKKLATLFFEPSTRTRLSFEAAMYELGGNVLGFSEAASSSAAKGETVEDTIRIVSNYADIIAMRHPLEGAPRVAVTKTLVPIINAGDGGHLHPTQTLTDLVTLYNEIGRLDHLKIGLCGDLKYGRTVHSLIKTMSHFEGNEFILISTKDLRVPGYIKSILKASGCKYTELNSLSEAMPLLDVLYMTRIQRERFNSEEEYKKQSGVFVLDTRKLSLGKKTLKILHPLPRVDEITTEVDNDPRAVYFKQAVYGMYARMALIYLMINEPVQQKAKKPAVENRIHKCSNPNCITNKELYLPNSFVNSGDMLTCLYCDNRMLI